MSYIISANHVSDYVVIEHIKYIDDIGWKTHTDWLSTYPEGDWTYINFGEDSHVKYEDFINSMVHKNVEVYRKMARLSLDNISTKDQKKLIRVMNAIKILDPTFVPPIINTACGWQNNLLEYIATSTSYRIISECKNTKRLGRYFRVFQL
jgi:hypothetical protein